MLVHFRRLVKFLTVNRAALRPRATFCKMGRPGGLVGAILLAAVSWLIARGADAAVGSPATRDVPAAEPVTDKFPQRLQPGARTGALVWEDRGYRFDAAPKEVLGRDYVYGNLEAKNRAVCPSGGGARFRAHTSVTVAVCCGHADNHPVGAGWRAFAGQYALVGHEGQPCTFFEKDFDAGEVTVCCQRSWATGAFVAARKGASPKEARGQTIRPSSAQDLCLTAEDPRAKDSVLLLLPCDQGSQAQLFVRREEDGSVRWAPAEQSGAPMCLEGRVRRSNAGANSDVVLAECRARVDGQRWFARGQRLTLGGGTVGWALGLADNRPHAYNQATVARESAEDETQRWVFLAPSAPLNQSTISRQVRYVSVDMTSLFNFGLPWMLKGLHVFGPDRGGARVPFELSGVVDNNAWHSYVGSDEGIKTLSIPVHVFGVTRVFTLMNTFWGAARQAGLCSITFVGRRPDLSPGASYQVDVVAGVHVRDHSWRRSGSKLRLDAERAVPAFERLNSSLDMQTWTLPTEFQTQYLEEIILQDSGRAKLQRVFIAAVSVETLVTDAWARSNKFVPIDFSKSHNFGLSWLPTGTLSLGPDRFGAVVPFTFGRRRRVWHGLPGEGRTKKLVVPVKQFGVQRVYTLIGSWWGQRNNGRLCQLAFRATSRDGVTRLAHNVTLRGDWELRDHNAKNAHWANLLQAENAVQVWRDVRDRDGRRAVLDMQTWVLPSAMRDMVLDSVELIDDGAANYQRVFLAGLTVQTSRDRAIFSTVDMSSVLNNALDVPPPASRRARYGPDFEGTRVPIQFSEENSRFSFAEHKANGTEVQVTLPVNRFGARKVYTVMHTWWGARYVHNISFIEFIGKTRDERRRTVFSREIVNGMHVRDGNRRNKRWANAIASRRSVNGETSNWLLYDMQSWELPPEFLGLNLEAIKLYLRGGDNISRLIWYATTVEHHLGPPLARHLRIGLDQRFCIELASSNGIPSPGTGAQLAKCDAESPSQVWHIFSDGTLRPSRDRRFCLVGVRQADSPLQLADCSAAEPLTLREWRMPDDQRIGVLRAEHGLEWALAPKGGAVAQGVPLVAVNYSEHNTALLWRAAPPSSPLETPKANNVHRFLTQELCLAVSGAAANGAGLELAKCAESAAEQQWRLFADGTLRFGSESDDSEWCVTAAAPEASKAVLGRCGSAPRWQEMEFMPTTHVLRLRAEPSLVLDLVAGRAAEGVSPAFVRVHNQQDVPLSALQSMGWLFASAGFRPTVPETRVIRYRLDEMLCVTLESGSLTAGSSVHLRPCYKADHPQSLLQRWRLYSVDSSLRFEGAHGGDLSFCLDVKNASVRSGQPVVVNQCAAQSATQRFSIDSDGRVALLRLPNYALDVGDGNSVPEKLAAGPPIVLWRKRAWSPESSLVVDALAGPTRRRMQGLFRFANLSDAPDMRVKHQAAAEEAEARRMQAEREQEAKREARALDLQRRDEESGKMRQAKVDWMAEQATKRAAQEATRNEKTLLEQTRNMKQRAVEEGRKAGQAKEQAEAARAKAKALQAELAEADKAAAAASAEASAAAREFEQAKSGALKSQQKQDWVTATQAEGREQDAKARLGDAQKRRDALRGSEQETKRRAAQAISSETERREDEANAKYATKQLEARSKQAKEAAAEALRRLRVSSTEAKAEEELQKASYEDAQEAQLRIRIEGQAQHAVANVLQKLTVGGGVLSTKGARSDEPDPDDDALQSVQTETAVAPERPPAPPPTPPYHRA